MTFIYFRRRCVHWRQCPVEFTVPKKLAAKKDAYLCNVISRETVESCILFQNYDVVHAVDILSIWLPAHKIVLFLEM